MRLHRHREMHAAGRGVGLAPPFTGADRNFPHLFVIAPYGHLMGLGIYLADYLVADEEISLGVARTINIPRALEPAEMRDEADLLVLGPVLLGPENHSPFPGP